uniref:Cnidarian restricted protein n=1 Tax=Clytia hemisphaerica TaxID=252671 RepID=A0A7M5V5L2_9CNID|eukprot:TCONS_00058824-protein
MKVILFVALFATVYSVQYELKLSQATYVTHHVHVVDLSDIQDAALHQTDCNSGTGLDVQTSLDTYHYHEVKLCKDGNDIKFLTCDDQDDCWDQHPRILKQL